MATERLLMLHIREILRLKCTLHRSHRDTARSLGISAGAVASVVTRAKAMALTWDAVGSTRRTRRDRRHPNVVLSGSGDDVQCRG